MSQTYKIEPIPERINEITQSILNAAYEVHTVLGPGLLESIYEACLAHELRKRGHTVEKQVTLPVIYKGERMEVGLRMDLVVDGCVILEVKVVETLLAIHQAQLLTYLKLTGHRVGLLLNFNSLHLKDGIKRVVH